MVIVMYRKFFRQRVINLLAIGSPAEFYSRFIHTTGPILHIGGHEGEEQAAYEKMGFSEIFWVEAQPEAFAKLTKRINPMFCLEAAVWSERTTLDLNISSNSVSTSLLEFRVNTPWKEVTTSSRINIKTITLEDTVNEFNKRGLLLEDFFLLLDIQGAEFEVLKGLRPVSKKIYAISCEVSIKPTYKDGARRKQIIWQLLKYRFIPLCGFLTRDFGHGDQLFIKLDIKRTPKLIAISIARALLLLLIRVQIRMSKRAHENLNETT